MKISGVVVAASNLMVWSDIAGAQIKNTSNVLSYPTQGGWIHNWLVAEPQNIAVAPAGYKFNADLRAPVVSQFFSQESLISGAILEDGAAQSGEAALTWKNFRCEDDHLVDLSVWHPKSDYVRAWASCILDVPSARVAKFELCTNDPAVVFVGEKRVFSHREFENVNCLKSVSQPIIFNWQNAGTSKIKNVTLSNVTVRNYGTEVGANLSPMDGGYPDANHNGIANAYGIWARGVDGLTLNNCQFYSAKLMPLALTSSNIWFGPATGVSRSISCNASMPPKRLTRTIFMIFSWTPSTMLSARRRSFSGEVATRTQMEPKKSQSDALTKSCVRRKASTVGSLTRAAR